MLSLHDKIRASAKDQRDLSKLLNQNSKIIAKGINITRTIKSKPILDTSTSVSQNNSKDIKNTTSIASNHTPKSSWFANVSIVGIIGAGLIFGVIVGGYFVPEFFAFWKFEGNLPGIIEGGNYIMPLNQFLIILPDIGKIASDEILIFLAIYLPFLIAGVVGGLGSLLGNRKIMRFAGFIGTLAVPLSIFVTSQLMVAYGAVLPGMEWTGLLDFYHMTGMGAYTMALWTGFFGCAVGSYMIYYGRRKAA